MDGIYAFSWTQLTTPGTKINTVLFVAGQHFAYTHVEAHKISYFRSASQSAVVKLKKGDTVMIRTYKSDGQHVHEYWSYFSGFKI